MDIPTPNELQAMGGRITHFREANGRIVTAAYLRRDDRVVYGATIYNPSRISETREGQPRRTAPWDRRAHVRTAITRLIRNPVYFDDSDDMTGGERRDAIRRAIRVLGCNG